MRGRIFLIVIFLSFAVSILSPDDKFGQAGIIEAEGSQLFGVESPNLHGPELYALPEKPELTNSAEHSNIVRIDVLGREAGTLFTRICSGLIYSSDQIFREAYFLTSQSCVFKNTLSVSVTRKKGTEKSSYRGELLRSVGKIQIGRFFDFEDQDMYQKSLQTKLVDGTFQLVSWAYGKDLFKRTCKANRNDMDSCSSIPGDEGAVAFDLLKHEPMGIILKGKLEPFPPNFNLTSGKPCQGWPTPPTRTFNFFYKQFDVVIGQTNLSHVRSKGAECKRAACWSNLCDSGKFYYTLDKTNIVRSAHMETNQLPKAWKDNGLCSNLLPFQAMNYWRAQGFRVTHEAIEDVSAISYRGEDVPLDLGIFIYVYESASERYLSQAFYRIRGKEHEYLIVVGAGERREKGACPEPHPLLKSFQDEQ